jgi:hypothetical protein
MFPPVLLLGQNMYTNETGGEGFQIRKIIAWQNTGMKWTKNGRF